MVDGLFLATSPGGDDFHDRKVCYHYINTNHPKYSTKPFSSSPYPFTFGYLRALSLKEIADELHKRVKSCVALAKSRSCTLVLMFWAKNDGLDLLFTLSPELADIFRPDSEW